VRGRARPRLALASCSWPSHCSLSPTGPLAHSSFTGQIDMHLPDITSMGQVFWYSGILGRPPVPLTLPALPLRIHFDDSLCPPVSAIGALLRRACLLLPDEAVALARHDESGRSGLPVTGCIVAIFTQGNIGPLYTRTEDTLASHTRCATSPLHGRATLVLYLYESYRRSSTQRSLIAAWPCLLLHGFTADTL
jgi:hypothetical protein